MSGPVPRARLDAREQWPLVVAVAPYLLLAILTAITVAEKHSSGGLTVDLVLCGLAALWMLCMVTLRPAWRESPPAMAVFFTVLMAIMTVLVVRDPWWGFFAPAGYLYAFRLILWPWQLLGVAVVAALAGTAQASAIGKTTLLGFVVYLAVVAANTLPMCGFAWFARRSREQNDQREQALREAREANRRLEASLAENAGLHERLVAQARETGIMDERQRMAREIHDTLAQGLTGIITQLQAAEQAEDDTADWRRHVTAATRLARESLTEARRSVHALRPEPLETARLSEALTGVAGRWSALHGLAVEVTTTGTARPMEREVEVALLRTAQEALANVARHARATRVGVTLSYMENEVALDVRDDGCGFDPAKMTGERTETGGGFGLVAMRQRIEGLSGTLQVESEPGAGTGISACVPAGPAEASA
ncbi:sensor histidine kinase [Actinoallomurus sp. NBC_01490]|uniref:sensor histidine kinase n=1 Tax=Actinoallomurus sp. NBC_01490 TaxID=2903557 RepID=UPI002E374153|nr:sensor histidine kinase [Actinoallomurus sp. NBC_01490]